MEKDPRHPTDDELINRLRRDEEKVHVGEAVAENAPDNAAPRPEDEKKKDGQADEESDQSFPASDPPANY